jgi:prepilin-type N-terminal cleavage/methylation domain-containing protein
MRDEIMLNKIRSNKGLTLIELLVASTIALICTGAALELYITQQRGWLAQENITDMQQNGRAAVDELAFHIRQAGYHIPAALDAMYSSDANPDTITIIYMKEPMCNAELTEPMPQPSSELKCEPDSIGCFMDDTWAYIYDPVADDGEFFEITQVQYAAGHLQHNTMTLSKKYPAGSQIFMIETASFYIDTTDIDHPKLMVEYSDGLPQIYADNIEDLQFSYTLAHGAITDEFVSSRQVREVNIYVVARTERLDFITGEDFVRDTFETSIYVRNLSF